MNTENQNQSTAATEGCAPAAGYAAAEQHPKFPRHADPFTQSAWRIGWEKGHGLRKAPKGIKYGLENTYRLGLRIAAEDRHTTELSQRRE